MLSILKVFSSLTGFMSPGTIPLYSRSKGLCSKESSVLEKKNNMLSWKSEGGQQEKNHGYSYKGN